jgi:putative redox protein
MTIELKRDLTAAMAQQVQIRGHAFTADVSEAEGGADSRPQPARPL